MPWKYEEWHTRGLMVNQQRSMKWRFGGLQTPRTQTLKQSNKYLSPLIHQDIELLRLQTFKIGIFFTNQLNK